MQGATREQPKPLNRWAQSKGLSRQGVCLTNQCPLSTGVRHPVLRTRAVAGLSRANSPLPRPWRRVVHQCERQKGDTYTRK